MFRTELGSDISISCEKRFNLKILSLKEFLDSMNLERCLGHKIGILQMQNGG